MKQHLHAISLSLCSVCLLLMVIAVSPQFLPRAHAGDESRAASEDSNRVLGLETVIAFYGDPGLKSQTFVRGGDWKQSRDRGAVASKGVTHQRFLSKAPEEAAEVLAGLDCGGNPNPVIDIDEFGWDYDGGIDGHCINVLKALHRKRPELNVAVWQMRGPVAPKLAATYRDTVALVLMETYFDLNDAWMIAFQLQTARLNGLLDRSVVALGLGKESDDKGGHRWTQTPEELEQQLRLIRFVAPESPGVAFFGSWKLKEINAPLTVEQVNEICGQFRAIPTDGSGLKPELLELGQTFTKRYQQSAIFCSSAFVLPYFHSGHDGGPWGSVHKPDVARLLVMNLGEQDANGVEFRLRDRERGVWAAGPVDIPARSVVVAVLPILPNAGFWGWGGTSVLEVDAPPGCEVFSFLDSRFHGKQN